MAVKICRVCHIPKTVQPRADNTISYWTCMKCGDEEPTPKKRPLLKLLTGMQSLRAA